MANNEVKLNGTTLLTVRDTTATEADVATGKVFTKKDGTKGTGIGVISAPVLNVPTKAINFYDYDGTCVAAYEFSDLPLVALPTPPDHSNDEVPLTFIEWNWTLEEVNAQTFPADVGATYIPTDGKTHLIIEINNLSTTGKTVTLRWRQFGESVVSINWGDGSAIETKTTTGALSTNHIYENTGRYDISIDADIGTYQLGGDGSSTYCIVGRTSSSGTTFGYARGKLKECYIGQHCGGLMGYVFSGCLHLSKLTIPTSITSLAPYTANSCYNLKFVVLPVSIGSSLGSNTFDSSGLERICLPYGVQSIGYPLCDNVCLMSLSLPKSLKTIKNGFSSCGGLTEIWVPEAVTEISGSAFSYCSAYDWHLLPSTPPTLGATSSISISSSSTIYVPVGSLEAYQTATNWSTFSSKMQEEPQ